MTNLKQHKLIFLFLLFLLSYSSLSAQVTIGIAIAPKVGALLDLKENNNLQENATKGLLMPRVKLKEANSLQPLLSNPSASDRLAHAGLIVYNMTTDLPQELCPGLYTWDDGSGWTRLQTPCIAAIDDSDLKQTADVTDLMLTKAEQFKNALDLKSGKRASVYLYNSKSVTTYLNNPEKLAARLKLLGFTDVYTSISKEGMQATGIEGTARNEWMKRFNKAIYNYGMTAHAVRYGDTKMYVEANRIDAEHAMINSFNNNAHKEEQFYGVIADLEPHTLSATTAPGIDIVWDSANGYGIGNANDQLLGRTMNILSQARQKVPSLLLGEAIWFKYQEQVNNGLLEHGGVNEFLSVCDDVNVMAYNNKKETIWRWCEFSISASLKPKSVFTTIKTSVNTTGGGSDATSLQPQGWSYLLETMNYLHQQTANKVAMKGISIFEYEGLEIMWEWLNDKN